MGNQRIERIKDIIRSADAELMEARARVYPIEYAAAMAELKSEEALQPAEPAKETKE
jgi:hypothetical protein